MLLAAVLNRLLAQDAAAKAELAQFAGRTIKISLPLVSATLVLMPDGCLAESLAEEAEATLDLPPSFFTRRMQDKTAAARHVRLSGDGELGSRIGHVLSGLRWDAAEELSKLIGDVATQRLVSIAGKVGGVPGAIGSRLVLNLAEYWRDEAPLLAHKRDVNQFCNDVDELRDALARLEKRLQFCEKNI
ncbi:ubiquinone biosynthesis accessory factor UbiJ [Iodobacter ciconiae]|uniref:Ubiquinone biosynthesis accessory factor UbiJ n=1 Tax=Iodobacter ciconiae TaxID=2496266 RepID=A0A3S8ZTW6_9NEIS|nr:SCP2 sterol-binding domain-containing protein [Iodobacter ciconiae]AZN36906.1 sterol-binding protein [Iodobacter ciconiae]